MNIEKHIKNCDDNELVIPEDNALRIFSKEFTKSEVFEILSAYVKIEESGIPVPKINKFFSVGDRWGILEDNIKGKTMLEILSEEPDNIDEILETMAEYQITIHEKIIPGIMPLKEKLRYQINSLDILDGGKKKALLETVNSAPDMETLLHGNYGPDVVINTKNDDTYIIGWNRVVSGNAEADAAMTYLKIAIGSTVGAETYIKIFSEKSGTDIEYIRKWIPVMAASQLADSTISHLHKEILYAWLDIMSGIDDIMTML